MALGKFEDREERALHASTLLPSSYRRQQSIGGTPPPKISRLLLVSSKIFYGYVHIQCKIFGFFNEIFGGLYFGGG